MPPLHSTTTWSFDSLNLNYSVKSVTVKAYAIKRKLALTPLLKPDMTDCFNNKNEKINTLKQQRQKDLSQEEYISFLN